MQAVGHACEVRLALIFLFGVGKIHPTCGGLGSTFWGQIKGKTERKGLALCLFAFTLAGKFLNPIAVAVATLYWYQTPVPFSSL